ncbi:hypothetical protein BZG36_00560 [Bifiguratus adelaidae]|uniref:PROP1-like PPR domain-containing protein n=1 Tax=Bifiguratus adelaidae TaxID=1938954 RepID=A0A261Y7H5_9FUNG|nr:hypothetical protein BZG36_00560 [Bifiguratus adelaidae]
MGSAHSISTTKLLCKRTIAGTQRGVKPIGSTRNTFSTYHGIRSLCFASQHVAQRRYAQTQSATQERSETADDLDIYYSAALNQSQFNTSQSVVQRLRDLIRLPDRTQLVKRSQIFEAWECYEDLRNHSFLNHLTDAEYRQLVYFFSKSSSQDRFGVDFLLSLISDMASLGHAMSRREKLALMYVFGRNGHLDEVEKLFKNLRSEQDETDHRGMEKVYRGLLRAYRFGSVKKETQVLQKTLDLVTDMAQLHLSFDSKTCAALLKGLKHHGSLTFEKNQVWTWASELMSGSLILSGRLLRTLCVYFADAQDSTRANAIFEYMQRHDMPIDNHVLSTLIGAIGRKESLNKALALLNDMTKRGFQPTILTFNMLLGACLKQPDRISTRHVKDIVSKVANSSVKPNMATFCALAELCNRSGDLETLGYILSHVRATRRSVHPRIYGSLIQCLIHQDLPIHSDKLFALMKSDQCLPNRIICNLLLHDLARKGKANAAKALVHKMTRIGIVPDIVTYGTLMTAYSNNGDVDNVQKVAQEIFHVGLEPNPFIYTTLIDAHVKAGDLIGAEQVFHLMQAKSPQGTAPHNAMLHGYILLGSMEKAESVFEAMQCSSNVSVDRHTFEHMLEGYCRHDNMMKANSLLSQMQASGIPPKTSSFTILLRAYLTHGDVQGVQNIVSDMRFKTLSLDLDTYSNLLRKCPSADVLQETQPLLKSITRPQRVPRDLAALAERIQTPGAYYGERSLSELVPTLSHT